MGRRPNLTFDITQHSSKTKEDPRVHATLCNVGNEFAITCTPRKRFYCATPAPIDGASRCNVETANSDRAKKNPACHSNVYSDCSSELKQSSFASDAFYCLVFNRLAPSALRSRSLQSKRMREMEKKNSTRSVQRRKHRKLMSEWNQFGLELEPECSSCRSAAYCSPSSFRSISDELAGIARDLRQTASSQADIIVIIVILRFLNYSFAHSLEPMIRDAYPQRNTAKDY